MSTDIRPDLQEPHTGALKTAVLTGRDALDVLAAEWKALPAPSVFLTWEWASCWWHNFGAAARPWMVVARNACGQLEGLAPLAVVDTRVGPLPAGRLLTWLGAEGVSADHLDLITVDPTPADACRQALLDAIWQSRQDWDALWWTDVPETSPTIGVVAAWAEAHGLRVLQKQQDECPVLALPPDWDTLEAELSPNFRQHLRRHARRLQRDMGANVIMCTREEDVPGFMDVLETLHAERRKTVDGRPGVFSRAGFRNFHRELATVLLRRGWLRLGILDTPQGPLAASYCFSHNGVTSFYQSGLSGNAPHLSCGQVLMAAMIRDAVESGIREFDFLRGQDAYKDRWTRRNRRTVSLFVAQPSAAGNWAWWARAGRRHLRAMLAAKSGIAL